MQNCVRQNACMERLGKHIADDEGDDDPVEKVAVIEASHMDAINDTMYGFPGLCWNKKRMRANSSAAGVPVGGRCALSDDDGSSDDNQGNTTGTRKRVCFALATIPSLRHQPTHQSIAPSLHPSSTILKMLQGPMYSNNAFTSMETPLLNTLIALRSELEEKYPEKYWEHRHRWMGVVVQMQRARDSSHRDLDPDSGRANEYLVYARSVV
jgi:hypothetical protein